MISKQMEMIYIIYTPHEHIIENYNTMPKIIQAETGTFGQNIPLRFTKLYYLAK
jgi:hypothetical protein